MKFDFVHQTVYHHEIHMIRTRGYGNSWIRTSLKETLMETFQPVWRRVVIDRL